MACLQAPVFFPLLLFFPREPDLRLSSNLLEVQTEETNSSMKQNWSIRTLKNLQILKGISMSVKIEPLMEEELRYI